MPASWVGAGGPYSVAALRIAVAASVLACLYRLFHIGHFARGDEAPLAMYHPVGVLFAWPGRPSHSALTVVFWVGVIAAVMMAIGLRSRTSAVLTALCLWILTSYDSAFAPTWSHRYNLPTLAALVFASARCGDVWSVDAWLTRKQPRSLAEPSHYAWPILLVTFAVAMVFVSAGLSKLYSGGPKLAWIFSDNLRNQIAARFGMSGLPRTELADWIVQSPWHYKTVAFLNVANQLLPIAALFLMRRPLLRAFVGICVLFEIAGLDLVMGLANYEWMPLAAVFFDWDRLRAWLIRNREANPSSAPRETVGLKRWQRIAIATFAVINLAYCLGLNQTFRAYPLSGYPMFAKIRAAKPYSEHLPFDMKEGHVVIISTPPLDQTQAWRINRLSFYRKLANEKKPQALRNGLAALLDYVKREYPGLVISSVAIWQADYRIPAYPAPPDVTPIDRILHGELSAAGVYRSETLSINQ